MSGSREEADGLEFREIVMGLRLRCAGMQAGSVDLHAHCLLLDRHGRVVESIHPGRTRNACGSVVHTGSAVSASGDWDHERIFVFLDALPPEVARLVFSVASASGRGLGHAAGAACHISDRNTEQFICRRELRVVRDAVQVASMARCRAGWRFVPLGRALQATDDTGEELPAPGTEEPLPLLPRQGPDWFAANG